MVLPLIFAFQIGSPVSGACHEAITLAGSTGAHFPDPSAAPSPTENQARALEDLPFDLPADRHDVWTMTLVIGVRSNDVHDNALSDVAALISIHDDPADQPAHCLRKPEDDGNDGDVAAIASCRAFILDELTKGGLLADTIETTATEPVAVFLAFRGRVVIGLPKFAYHLGRAIHALEDGYAHQMRDPMTGHVRSVMNWIDYITSDHYDPAIDGYMHLSKVDDCRRDEEYEVLRVHHATEAVTALIAAVADDTGGAAGRATRVGTALDAAFTLDPGCTAAGALNVYATVAYTWYDGRCFTLYSRGEIGSSTILFELVGVDKYHTGLYVGGSLLGVSFKRSERWRLTLDPSHFAMPAPQLSGVPFYYRQYRISVGAEYRF